MLNPHPTYPNPSIVQVICEIGFAAHAPEKLSVSGFYALFGKEYPEILPVGNINVQLVLGQPQFVSEPPQAHPVAVALRFGTEDNSSSVQVSQSNFVFQTSGPYLGWAAFKTPLLDLWSRAATLLKPNALVKVGLRYTNRIPLSADYPRVSDWLKSTRDLPESIIRSEKHFLARVESTPAPQDLRLITVANEAATPENPHGAIIFDLDRVCTDVFEFGGDDLSKKLDTLHEDVWKSFVTAHTEVFERRLSGK